MRWRQRIRSIRTSTSYGSTILIFSVANRIAQREAEIARLSAAVADVASAQPLRDRLAVIPTWVRAQVQALAGLLSEAPERTKQEFRRMGLRVTMQPIYDEQPRPFYRATVDSR